MTTGRVVVIGGAMLDVVATSSAELVPGTSNPAVIRTSPGGVGRNIAENLARLGTSVELVTAVGADLAGDMVRERCAAAGVQLTHVVTSRYATGTYTAVLQPEGTLSVGACDAEAMDALTFAEIEPALTGLTEADIVVVDANIGPDVIAGILGRLRPARVRSVLDVVSYPKAMRLREVVREHPPWMLTPNLEELVALIGRPVAVRQIDAAAAHLLATGVDHVWARLGPMGSVLTSCSPDGRPEVREYPAAAARVVDVTGAGDALTAGFLHALLSGSDVGAAAAYGHQVSALTLMTNDSVRADLSEDLVAAGTAAS